MEATETRYSPVVQGGGDLFGNDPSIADINTSANRWETADVKSAIRETIHNQSGFQEGAHRHIDRTAHNAEKASICAGYEAKLETKDSTRRIFEKIDRETDRLNDKMTTFQLDTEKNFRVTNEKIDAKFGTLEKDMLNARIADLQRDNDRQGLLNGIADLLVKK